VLRALRGYVYAGYDLAILGDLPQVFEDPDPDEFEERCALALGELEEVLVQAGADPTRARDPQQRLSLIYEGVERGGHYALLLSPAGDLSFSLVRIRDVDPRRERVLFGDGFSYTLILHDETVLLDYPSYLAQKMAGRALSRPATYRSDGTVLVDEESIRRLGREQFLPNVGALRASARRSRAAQAFLDLAHEDPAELLTLTKDALRWRSLEQLWSRLSSLPEEQQEQRFAEEYALHAELRAACDLREVSRLSPDALAELDDERRVLLLELGVLSAMVHGEPLGHAADLLALAAASLRDPGASASPTYQAARHLVTTLVTRLREEGGDPAEADAVAFHRLAWVDPESLRWIAEQYHGELLEQLGGR
jgi:hypothetical protein